MTNALEKLNQEIQKRKESRLAHYNVIIQLHKSGMTQADIARKMKITRERVRQILVKYGGHTSRKLLRPEVIKLYEEGLCLDEIGKKLKRGSGNIRQVLWKCNIAVPENRFSTLRRDMLKFISEGKSIQEIADIRGVNNSSAYCSARRLLTKEEFAKLLDIGETIRINKISNPGKKEEINRLARNGKTIQEIADTLGVTNGSVCYMARKCLDKELLERTLAVGEARRVAKIKETKSLKHSS